MEINLLNLSIFKLFPRQFERFAIKKKGLIGIEIGVWEGRHAKSIISELALRKVYLIDPYTSYNKYGPRYMRRAEKRAKRRIDIVKGKGRTNKIGCECIWIKKTSIRAISKIKEKVDFIYLDGNHSYNYVKAEIELYYNLLKDGGVIGGHDIGMEEVTRAVIEFAVKNNLKLYILGNDWWINKGEFIQSKVKV